MKLQPQLKLRLQTTIKTPLKTPIRTTIPPFIPTLGEETSPFVRIMAKKIKRAFEVQVRREGKWKVISKKPLPKGLAMKLGAQRVTKTLAATFRLKAKGFTKKRDVPFKLSSLQFRLPKSREKLTFVEIKTKRIKKGTAEIPEILKIRRTKGRRKNIWGI